VRVRDWSFDYALFKKVPANSNDGQVTCNEGDDGDSDRIADWGKPDDDCDGCS
jgi:hypothetical protein